MMRARVRGCGVQALLAAALLCIGSAAWADKPAWAGGNGEGRHERKDKPGGGSKDKASGGPKSESRAVARPSSRDGGGVSVSVYFGDRHRSVAHEYFVREYRSGRCPPGLAKKGNGCLPPGQAKNWRVGRPLPREVIFHDLPPAVLVELGPPPAGHRFVRVAADILLIAVGTAMVVDAIEDLGRL